MTVAKLNLLLLAVLVSFACALAGCSSRLQIPDAPREVKVPVPVPCVDPKDVPERPLLRSVADLMGMDRYRRTLAAWSDLRKYEAYAAELEKIAAGCSRLATP